jgi:hypothetical protein
LRPRSFLPGAFACATAARAWGGPSSGGGRAAADALEDVDQAEVDLPHVHVHAHDLDLTLSPSR